MDDDDPAQLGLDLFDDRRGAARHHGDARAVAQMVDLGHGQAVDVVAAPRKQADDTGQHARLVFDHDRQGVAFLDLAVGVLQVIGRMAGHALLDVQCVHG